MKLKSYFSGTVEAAMALARKELGDEALLVNARPATPETRSLGAFEVVFGVVPAGVAAPAQTGKGFQMFGNRRGSEPNVRLNSNLSGSLNNDVNSDPNNHPNSELNINIVSLKREMAHLVQVLRGAHPPPVAGRPEEQEMRTRLLAQELDPELVEQVVRGALLDDLFAVDTTLGRPGASRAVVALVGPPGAGKTTTLIKLAARYGLASHRAAQILSTDVFRIAAADQLRSLASILGIGCTVVETPTALAQALEEHRAKEFVFVDTPGLGRGDMQDGADLAALIAAHPEIDTHLVLPASMKPGDLSDVIDRYQMFRPSKLLFTRLDETARFGMLVGASARSSLPISFVAAGQQIPDDLQPATIEMLSILVSGKTQTPPRSMRATA